LLQQPRTIAPVQGQSSPASESVYSSSEHDAAFSAGWSTTAPTTTAAADSAEYCLHKPDVYCQAEKAGRGAGSTGGSERNELSEQGLGQEQPEAAEVAEGTGFSAGGAARQCDEHVK